MLFLCLSPTLFGTYITTSFLFLSEMSLQRNRGRDCSPDIVSSPVFGVHQERHQGCGTELLCEELRRVHWGNQVGSFDRRFIYARHLDQCLYLLSRDHRSPAQLHDLKIPYVILGTSALEYKGLIAFSIKSMWGRPLRTPHAFPRILGVCCAKDKGSSRRRIERHPLHR